MQNNQISDVSTLKSCLNIFSLKDRRKITLVVVLQFILGALDLLGVLLIGIIGALAVAGIQSVSSGTRVIQALEFLGIEDFTFQQQTAILAAVASVILVSRTLLSVIVMRKILFFIGRRSAIVSGNLIRRLLQQDSLQVNKRTIQETIYASTNGVVAVTLGVIGTTISIIADVSLLFVMAIGLFLIDPIIASSTFILFALTGLCLHAIMHGRAVGLGKREAELNIFSNEKISEVLISYRETTVKARRGYYAENIASARYNLSDVLAELNFMPMISKYVIEVTLVIGVVSVAALQFYLEDSGRAVATLAIFMAAAARIAPAVLRVQQGSIIIKSSLGSAKETLVLLSQLPVVDTEEKIPRFQNAFEGLTESVDVSDVKFIYPGNEIPALIGINLKIEAGSTCAIVGPSGSGKTTLVDLILGMFHPTSGSVLISGDHPAVVIKKFPGAIAYVPQDVSIIQGTIRENVALGYPITDAIDSRVMAAIRIAQLEEFVAGLPQGLDTYVGPRGSKLSGGQRQRLGIARAMFTKPKLLILDESTSALDAQVEVQVSEALQSIPYDVTKIVIAHRLSTVRDADNVVYLDRGRILAQGTFEQVRLEVPDFDRQASLMGL